MSSVAVWGHKVNYFHALFSASQTMGYTSPHPILPTHSHPSHLLAWLSSSTHANFYLIVVPPLMLATEGQHTIPPTYFLMKLSIITPKTQHPTMAQPNPQWAPPSPSSSPPCPTVFGWLLCPFVWPMATQGLNVIFPCFFLNENKLHHLITPIRTPSECWLIVWSLIDWQPPSKAKAQPISLTIFWYGFCWRPKQGNQLWSVQTRWQMPCIGL